MRWRGLRALLHALPFVLIGVLGWLYRDELQQSFAVLSRTRLFIVVVVPLFLLWNQLAAMGWRSGLAPFLGRNNVPGPLALGIFKIQSQSINAIVPLAGVGGELARASLATRGRRDRLPGAMAATVLDNVAGTAAGLAFAIPLMTWIAMRGSRQVLWCHLACGIAALGAVVLLTLVVLTLGARMSTRVRHPGWLVNLLAPFAQGAQGVRAAFWRAMGWRFLERLVCSFEVYIGFRALGFNVGWLSSASVSAAFIVVSLVVFFLPGQVGAAEASAAIVCPLLGIPPSAGLAVALLRRARQLLVCATGLLLLPGSRWGLGSVHPRHARESES